MGGINAFWKYNILYNENSGVWNVKIGISFLYDCLQNNDFLVLIDIPLFVTKIEKSIKERDEMYIIKKLQIQ